MLTRARGRMNLGHLVGFVQIPRLDEEEPAQ
jgi:hypothetical protein